MTLPTASEFTVAIPLPAEEELRAMMGLHYEPDRTLNVIKMFAGTEDMFPAVMGFIRAVFQARGIDSKTRAMIVLRAAKLYNARYEWEANAKMAANAGLTPAEIEGAASDGPVTGSNPDYVLICAATDELSKTGNLSDDLLQQLLSRYGQPTSRKLILIISWFNLLSRFVNATRVPLETTDKIGTVSSPV